MSNPQPRVSISSRLLLLVVGEWLRGGDKASEMSKDEFFHSYLGHFFIASTLLELLLK